MESQRKPQQRAELEICPKARYKHGEKLPEEKNSPEKQGHLLEAALGDKGVGAGIKGKTQSDDQDAREDARKDQADQVETIIPLAEAVP